MYLEIDFNNLNHQNYIIKLAQRNKYHILDMMLYMFDENLRYGKYEEYGGNFLTINKKVVGFILTYTDITLRFSRILYILVDKKYKKQGYGSGLIQNHITELKKRNEVKLVYVDAEKETIEWYEKNPNSKALKTF